MAEPKNLEEAMTWLAENLRELGEFRTLPEDQATFSVSGRAVRNKLRLWQQPRPPIWHFFNDTYKTDHPDDISSIIVTSLHRKLNQRPLDVAAQVCRCHEHWATVG